MQGWSSLRVAIGNCSELGYWAFLDCLPLGALRPKRLLEPSQLLRRARKTLKSFGKAFWGIMENGGSLQSENRKRAELLLSDQL